MYFRRKGFGDTPPLIGTGTRDPGAKPLFVPPPIMVPAPTPTPEPKPTETPYNWPLIAVVVAAGGLGYYFKKRRKS